MERADLAARLAEADNAEHAELLAQHHTFADTALAWALTDLCYDAWNKEPKRAVRAAVALAILADIAHVPEVRALADWTAGIAALAEGRMEDAVGPLAGAERGFTALDRPHTAAATQVSKLYPLAVLGRYDEAIACGERARDVFVAHGDELAAG